MKDCEIINNLQNMALELQKNGWRGDHLPTYGVDLDEEYRILYDR